MPVRAPGGKLRPFSLFLTPGRGQMIRLLLPVAVIAVIAGCAAGIVGCAADSPYAGPNGRAVVYHANPTLVTASDPNRVWETVVDVVDDDFKIEREVPVRQIGTTLTEGRIDTYPTVGATLLEPWRRDSVGTYQRLESTLQSIRRRAVVRVIPGEGGYFVDVAVFKELEDMAQPEHSTAGAATFSYDDTLKRVVNPVGEQSVELGWIPQGRDAALEQKILGKLAARCGVRTVPYSQPTPTPAPTTTPQPVFY